jgi:hypothetical protein
MMHFKEIENPLNAEVVNQTIGLIDYYIDQFRARETSPNSSYKSAPINSTYLQEMRLSDHQAWIRTMKSYFLRLHEWFIYSQNFKSHEETNELAAHFNRSLDPSHKPTVELFEKELCYQVEKWTNGH